MRKGIGLEVLRLLFAMISCYGLGGYVQSWSIPSLCCSFSLTSWDNCFHGIVECKVIPWFTFFQHSVFISWNYMIVVREMVVQDLAGVFRISVGWILLFPFKINRTFNISLLHAFLIILDVLGGLSKLALTILNHSSLVVGKSVFLKEI